MRQKTMQKRAMIHFSRWNRKGWSAFASMHREIKICVLSVSMSMISSAVLTGANKSEISPADTTLAEKLEKAQVTSTRAVNVRSAMPQVPLYQRSTDAATPIQSYESALRLMPSVDIRDRGGFSSQSDIAIRGGSADQTMVMLNGINFTDARTGHQSHSLPVDIESISAVTLIDGIPGAGALSGAVNIITTPLYQRYLRAELSGGMNGYLYGSASGAIDLKHADLFGAVSFRNSDGYKHNTDFRNWNAYFRTTSGTSATGLFDIQIGAQNRKFGSNGFYAAYNPDQYEQTSTYLASIRWSAIYGNTQIGASVSYRKNLDRYEWTRGTPSNWHNTDNIGADIRLSYNWIGGNSTLGGDISWNHILSSNLGEELDKPKGPDGRYKKSKSRSTGNIYFRHAKSWELGDISAMGGASFTPYGTTALWSVSGVVRPINSLSIKALIGQSMRLPTFTDLYYTSKAQINNLNLIPEKAINYNLGINYSANSWKIGVNGYFRDIRNRIAWVWRDEIEIEGKRYTSIWHSEQQSRMYIFGVEVSGGYISDTGFLRKLTASYGFIDSNEQSKLQISNALDYMRHKAAICIETVFLKRFSLSINASLYDRFGTYNDFDEDGKPIRDENGIMITQQKDYNPYFLLDARLNFKLKSFCLYVDGKNVTNTQYCDFGGITMPGAWVTGGIVVTIK